MYAESIAIDNTTDFSEETYQGAQLTTELLEELLRKLDGHQHTLLTITASGDRHMAIGGSSANGMVVYATEDNMAFANLLSDDRDSRAMVQVVAGGQPGEYEQRHVVSLAQALTAATQFMLDGSLARGLAWEEG